MIRGIAALLLITTGLAAPAKADTTPPELHSLTFSREFAVVSGLETKLLAVSARFTDDEGVLEDPGYNWGDFTPAVRIGQRMVRLTLSAGTAEDGVWTGGIAITSDWASGTYRPDRVVARDNRYTLLEVDPSTMVEVPSVEVTSSNKPVLTLTHSPQPAIVGGNLTRTVRVTDRATGQPMPGVPVVIAYDNLCVEGNYRTPVGRTNDAGIFASTTTGTADGGHCAWITSDNVPEQPATAIAPINVAPIYLWAVTARPASTAVPAGTNVAVTGTLAPWASSFELQLQRRYPDNTWRTVNRGKTDGNARFSILATPPSVATHSYRVFAPARPLRAANYSPVFTIRGT